MATVKEKKKAKYNFPTIQPLLGVKNEIEH